ncbi:MAG: glycosyltransferase family 39 protein, partial [Blastocatellia bacterium]|nr:glycosyltransferase family 39 protein [Blastocatellia bacterium]
MFQSRRTVTILTLALCVVYIAVRLWRLTDSCLWFDEIFSVHAAEHEWNSLFWFVAQDLIHPPLFYVLLKVWMSIGGESLIWLRLFPVFFSGLVLGPFIYLCRELKLKTPAMLLGLVFLAVNGSLIKYAQEVRMYAPLLFFSVVSTWLFARFYFRGKNIWILTLVNVLLIYTHYFGWFVIASEVAAIFIFQRVKIRHVLIMSGIALAAFVPWVIAVLRASSDGADVTQNIGWMARPGIRESFRFVFDVIEPFYYQQSNADASTILYVTIPLLLTIGAAKILMWMDWKREDDRGALYLVGLFVAVPILLAFAISWLAPVSIWGSRHLIIVFAPVAIMFGIFLSSVDTKPVRYGLIGFTLLLFLLAFVTRVRTPQTEYVWCGWEQVASEWALTPHNGAGPKRLYAFEDLAAYHLWFATRKTPNHRVSLMTGVDGILNDPAYFLPRGFDGVRKTVVEEITDERIWLAFRTPKSNEEAPL